MNYKKIFYLIIILISINFNSITYSKNKFTIYAKIESFRKENIITIVSENKITGKEYLLLHNDFIIGNIIILSININQNLSEKYRMIARYYIKHKDLRLLKSGSIIGLINKRKNLKIKYPDSRIIEKKKYKNKIISKIDNRIMVLIPGGNFLFGTNNGEKDEFPQHKKSLPDYYIDKFEVTNHDYSIFLKNTNVTPPRAWKGSTYNPKHKNLPVIVSYKEAEKYAKWAGKKLPTEEEWEKAANGTKHILNKITDKGLIQTLHFTIYPWGNKFNAAFCNSLNFWENKNIGISIKKQYQNGLLPVGTFKKGNSAFNACDMSGNAPEWTTSWYNAYPGNKISNKRYGRQVKVVRGGAWYNSAVKIRITARDYGGLPNLYDDNIAGFRCIKEPGNLDLK